MIEVVSRQRKIKIDLDIWQQFAAHAVTKIAETEGKYLTLAFVSDRRMRELNNQFRGKNTTTDVLSFPFEADEFETDENTLGDIVISVEQAERQAAENNLDFDAEVKQLILHGILHLCGYDHETDDGEMNAREIQLRDDLKI